jgi:glycosyltransferase involved in cell wall biosynthesis
MSFVIGIDASNLSQGGGRSYLLNILSNLNPVGHGISSIIIWGSKETLDLINNQKWLVKISPTELNKGLVSRVLWQKFQLSDCAIANKVDILFIPGGSYLGSFRPYVTINQNLLPFEWREIRRYFLSFDFFRLLALRIIQSKTIRKSDGVIFLSEYSKEKVIKIIGKTKSKIQVIPHGKNNRFIFAPKLQQLINVYTINSPFVIIYVSTIDLYKHQWNVIKAVAELREETGWAINLNIIGASNKKALKKLNTYVKKYDKESSWLKCKGEVPYSLIHEEYARADMSLFASSIENYPIILIESITSNLPIVCSNFPPMPQYMGERAEYFDPLSPDDIKKTLKDFINSPQKRESQINNKSELFGQYPWKSISDQTFKFLISFINSNFNVYSNHKN